jgi:endonuclease-3 related protein
MLIPCCFAVAEPPRLPACLTWVLATGYLAYNMNSLAFSAPPVASLAAAEVPVLLHDPADPPASLPGYFETLSRSLGPMHWWPARTPFEVIIGAILTQNTSWSNVERAIVQLRRARLLTPRAIERVSPARLARLVRPSGYFRQKAKKLKAFVRFLRLEYGGSLKRMFRTPTNRLREQLLDVHGIGPETADSILLYAGGHSVFVVDAYTHRIFSRHGLTRGKPDYEPMRTLVEARLPRDPRVYNEFHALLVHVGKHWCRPRGPLCGQCPLESYLPANSILRSPLAALRGPSPEPVL